jgi:predicted ArsR family transcriptional regulator
MAPMDTVPPDRDLAAIGLLQDPVRRALYGHVAGAGGEVSRNQAAEAVGVQRGLAAFHLDKLVEAGLLEASFRRLGKRRGPGAGRPAKLYRRARGEVAASLPPRTYETAARLLAETVEQAGADLELQVAARRARRRPSSGCWRPEGTSRTARGRRCGYATAPSPASPASTRCWSAP